MRSRSVLVVALALVGAPAGAQPDRSGEIRVDPAQRDQRNGVRMEGAARLEIIYGDAADLRRTVDRFYQLDERMTRDGAARPTGWPRCTPPPPPRSSSSGPTAPSSRPASRRSPRSTGPVRPRR